MTWPLIIEMHGAPRGKGRPRAAGSAFPGGRVVLYTDDRTRKFEAQLRFAGQQEMAGAAPTGQPLRVIVQARFPIAASWPKRKQAAAELEQMRPTTTPDVDNLLKTLDALNGIVWIDDRQIVEAIVSKVYSRSPGLTITVAPIAPPVVTSLAPQPVIHQTIGELFATQ